MDLEPGRGGQWSEGQGWGETTEKHAMFSDQMCLQPHWESALRSAHPKLSGTRAVLIKLSISGGSEGNTTHRAVQFLMVLKFFLFFFF